MKSSGIVTLENQKGVRTVSPEKRDWVRKESESILAKNILLRQKTKQIMYEKRLQHEKIIASNVTQRTTRWAEKTKNSPFAINLVAEDERIAEENQIRLKEESERRTLISSRKDKAKNEIILKVNRLLSFYFFPLCKFYLILSFLPRPYPNFLT
jgi:hypothetical protein